MFNWFKKKDETPAKDERYLIDFIRDDDRQTIINTLFVSKYIEWGYQIQGTIPQQGTNLVLKGKNWRVEECMMWFDHVSLAPRDRVLVRVYLREM